MTTEADTETHATMPQGPFALMGPVSRPDPQTVMPGGARLMSSTGEGSAEICTLMEGDSFEVLDVTGGWAWGCLTLEGPVGFVRLDRLEMP